MDRLLRLDPLRLRRLVPRRARQRLYDRMLRRYRPARGPALGGDHHRRLRAAQPRPGASAWTWWPICRSPRSLGLSAIVSVQATDAERRPVRTCAWCGRPLDDGPCACTGRTRCARCGAATTDPWPSEAELERAYGTWYRPEAGRFSFIGDAVLTRTRALLAGRLDRIAPAGPGAGRGRRRGRADRCPAPPWPRRDRPRARFAPRPTCATSR